MKENVTLSNACFRYDGSKEAVAIIRIMNTCYNGEFDAPFAGDLKTFYFINDNIRTAEEIQPSGFVLVSPSDYLSLLTPQQPERLLSEADLMWDIAICCETQQQFNDILKMNKISTLKPKDWLTYKEQTCVIGDTFIVLGSAKERKLTIAYAETYLPHFKLISPSAQEEDLSQQAQEEGKIDSKIIIGDNENIKCIADQIKEVFDKYKDEESRIELSAKISYYYFKNGINQYRKWKTESDNKLSSLQQEVDKMRELLKESKRFCGGSLQARIDNLLN